MITAKIFHEILDEMRESTDISIDLMTSHAEDYMVTVSKHIGHIFKVLLFTDMNRDACAREMSVLLKKYSGPFNSLEHAIGTLHTVNKDIVTFMAINVDERG